MAEGIQPKVFAPTAEWSQQNLTLPEEVGAFQRDCDWSYGPHAYGIMAALDDPEIEEVYCMKASQVLWTTILIAYIFNRICNMPGVILGMFASEGAATKFAREKFHPMGKATEALTKKVDFTTSRRTGSTTLRKEFDGGFASLFGSNTISNVKTTTAHFVFVEEPDDANENVNNQGDSIRLLFDRTKRVRKAKKVLGGTPSVKGFSRVEEKINLSEKLVLPVRCHDCHKKHVLSFENVVGWQADGDEAGERHAIYGYNKPERAVYSCPHCGSAWDDYQRKENIRNTVYLAMEAGEKFCGWESKNPVKKIAGFTELSELYSCLPGVGVQVMVETHLEAEYYASRGDDTKKIAFTNTNLGKPYEYADGRADAETLRENAKTDPQSQRPEKICPREGLLITVGVDVQDNRLAIVIRAHGRQRRSWLMYFGEIYAKGATSNQFDPVWDELDSIVFAAFEHENGRSMHASAISIDSGGHATEAVYQWCIDRQKKYPAVKIMAIKGSSSRTNPPVYSTPAPSKVLDQKNPEKLSKADKFGVKVYMVGTNQAKDYIASQMAANARGENRFHFYSHDEMRHDYFDQLLGEAKIPNRTGHQVWTQKSGCPVEAWDCEVYAEHAARRMKVHTMQDADWDNIEKKINQADLFEAAAPMMPVSSEPARRERRPSTYTRRT